MATPLEPDPAERARSEIVGRAEELYHDVQLECVRTWKTRNPGAKAMGFMPVYAPREIVHAAGMLPVGVLGAGESLEIVKGDAFFQSYICHIPRSTVELGLNGALDVLDGMLFPSTCDVIRNLSGMWRMLFPDRYVRYVDLPQNFSEEIGGEFFHRELRELAGDLERLSGIAVTDERLRRAIALYDENRRLIQEIYRLRARAPWLVPSSELYLIVRAGHQLPVDDHSAMLRDYLAAASSSKRHPIDMARVAIRGCFCEQPPLDLLRTLERSGCSVIDDDWNLSLRWIQGDVGADGDPMRRLVSAFLRKSPACPSMFLAEGKKGAALVGAARDARAEGVLFAAASFCDPALLDQPMTMAAVKEAGIPCTSFLYAENTAQFQVIREQAGTFADAIKLSE